VDHRRFLGDVPDAARHRVIVPARWPDPPGPRLAVVRPKEVCVLAEDHELDDVEALTDDDVDELLVEEVSIDGMCGVY
jgi:mycofactocin precursor